MESLKNFRRIVLKTNSGGTKHKINNSYGIKDYFKYYRKNKPNKKEFIIPEQLYCMILQRIHDLLIEDLYNNKEVILPFQMGTLEIRKYNIFPYFKNSKLIFRSAVNWNETLKLWYSDEESFKNKTLIKFEDKELFKIYFNKLNCKLFNLKYYHFQPPRRIRKDIMTKGIAKQLDAFPLIKK